MDNNLAIEIEEKEAERTESGGRGPLLAGMLLLSCAAHVGLMYTCSDVSFAPLPGEVKNDRKWTKQLPTMQVQKMAEDPLARALQEARPVAAPVEEKQETRVERLAPVAERSLTPDLPRAASTAPTADAIPEPAKPDAAAWQPRQEIAAIEAPTVPDEEAALPRLVIPKIERVSHAADIVPAFDLMQKPAAVGDAGNGAGGNDPARTGSLVAAVEEAAETIAPLAPPPPGTLAPGGLQSGGGTLGQPPSLNVLSAAERDVLNATATAEETAKAQEAAARLQAEKDKPVPPAPEASSVDEKVVAQEKEAVRTLRDETTTQGKPFDENVKFALGAFVDPLNPKEKYFHIRMSSRDDKPLPVISKDIVFLLDASGSIANDRLKNTRKAISKALRLLNTGDRFNVIAFRDKFTYAFPEVAWKDVDAKSLEPADDWMMRLTAHGQTDVFGTLRSILAMPRDPSRPVVALVVTDGEATSGMTRSAEIVSRFNALNGGLIAIYMYGVKENANAYLMDMVTRGSRGSWYRHEGMRWTSADGIPALAKKFERPVLTDLSVLFSSSSRAEVYPQLVSHLCADEPIEIWGKCPADQQELVFSIRGLNASTVYESVFRLDLGKAAKLKETTRTEWATRRMYALISAYTQKRTPALKAEIHAFADKYQIAIPYEKEIK